MCSGKAAEAPEFFLHHGFVDKMWADYQKQGSYHKNAFYPSIKKKMTVTKYLPKDLIDNLKLPGGVRVEYEDPTVHSAKKIRNFLRGKFSACRPFRFTRVIPLAFTLILALVLNLVSALAELLTRAIDRHCKTCLTC